MIGSSRRAERLGARAPGAPPPPPSSYGVGPTAVGLGTFGLHELNNAARPRGFTEMAARTAMATASPHTRAVELASEVAELGYHATAAGAKVMDEQLKKTHPEMNATDRMMEIHRQTTAAPAGM